MLIIAQEAYQLETIAHLVGATRLALVASRLREVCHSCQRAHVEALLRAAKAEIKVVLVQFLNNHLQWDASCAASAPASAPSPAPVSKITPQQTVRLPVRLA